MILNQHPTTLNHEKVVKKVLKKHNLDNVYAYLSILSAERAYTHILYLLRLYKTNDIDNADWITLVEIYRNEINNLECEIDQKRNSTISRRDTSLTDNYINNQGIKLVVEDFYLYKKQPLLGKLRYNDKLQERLLRDRNQPNTRNQLIAHYISLKQYYENRKKEIEASYQIVTQPNSLISEIISVINATVPFPKTKSTNTRGYEKSTPTKKQTHAEIQKCLADKQFYHDKKFKDPNAYQIYHQVHRRLNSKFEKGELPGVTRMVGEQAIKDRVKTYLDEIFYNR